MIFKYKYFAITVLFFIFEVLIATIFNNTVWICSYFGDVLVVILIYTFILSFFEVKNKMILNLGIFIFACTIEFAQYFHFAELLGLKNN